MVCQFLCHLFALKKYYCREFFSFGINLHSHHLQNFLYSLVPIHFYVHAFDPTKTSVTIAVSRGALKIELSNYRVSLGRSRRAACEFPLNMQSGTTSSVIGSDSFYFIVSVLLRNCCCRVYNVHQHSQRKKKKKKE